MTRDELIEAMLRALRDTSYGDAWETIDEATMGDMRRECDAQLSALCEAIPGLADVIDGKVVIVPADPTKRMMGACVSVAAPMEEIRIAFKLMVKAGTVSNDDARRAVAGPK